MTLQLPIFPWNYFQTSPAKQFLSLMNSPGILNPKYIDQIFQELKPIKPDNLMGEWDGFILSTGHPFGNDVAPLTVAKNGNRVRFQNWGGASLCEIKYQGIVSAALIYDERPMMVHYRAVRSNVVAGVMESKRFGQAGKVYFYLRK
ncbi:hypothetical protein N7507_008194 [Penicillium longicatenatum]|nr:hypothetical protein N7507_008194 [Penicillium longicatenatum]